MLNQTKKKKEIKYEIKFSIILTFFENKEAINKPSIYFRHERYTHSLIKIMFTSVVHHFIFYYYRYNCNVKRFKSVKFKTL